MLEGFAFRAWVGSLGVQGLGFRAGGSGHPWISRLGVPGLRFRAGSLGCSWVSWLGVQGSGGRGIASRAWGAGWCRSSGSSSSLLLSSLELSDTHVYEPSLRARLGTTAHLKNIVVLKLRQRIPGTLQPDRLGLTGQSKQIGLVHKAHKRLYHSTLGLRVIKKREELDITSNSKARV